MKSVTASSMACFQECPRKYYYNYELKLRPKKQSEALRIGTMVHLFIENLMTGKTKMASLAVVQEEYRKLKTGLDPWDIYLLDCEAEMVYAIMAVYADEYKAADSEMDVIEVENIFNRPFFDGIELNVMGKTDGIVGLKETFSKMPRNAIFETKTTSYDLDDSFYWRRLTIDHQISLYYLVNRDEHDITSVIYNVVRKPSIKPGNIPALDDDGLKQVVNVNTGERVANKNGSWKQCVSDSKTQEMLTVAETPVQYGRRVFEEVDANRDKYFRRKEITLLKDDIEEAKYDFEMIVAQMFMCDKGKHYPKCPQNCNKWRTACEYFDICTGGGLSGDSSSIPPEGFYYDTKIHPELEQKGN